MEKCGFEERPYPESYNAFHEGLRMLEESLRSMEVSEDTIHGLLQSVAEIYGAARASAVKAAWNFKIGALSHEWCAEGMNHQKDMLRHLAVRARCVQSSMIGSNVIFPCSVKGGNCHV